MEEVIEQIRSNPKMHYLHKRYVRCLYRENYAKNRTWSLRWRHLGDLYGAALDRMIGHQEWPTSSI